MLIPVRRIVTENDPQGRSRIFSDAPTPHTVETAADRGLSNLWIANAAAADLATPDGADRPLALSPGAGEIVFRFFQLPPAGQSKRGKAGAGEAQEIFARMGGTAEHVPGSIHPAMHRTNTIDCIVLLQGRVKLILDLEETVMNPFDVVIQKSTNHAWENLADTPALLVAVLLDAGSRN